MNNCDHIKHRIRALCGLFVCLVVYGPSLFGQCNTIGPILIEDLSTQMIPIEVVGADSNDLSSPFQGVCGIEIDFQHEFVGDLIIELISPGGQRITIIGPTGPFGLTEFTTWDIDIIPCMESAMPDAGFNNRWNNNQIWGIFGNYSGDYYPYQGCLEDFDTGPVNGEWTLFIQDSDLGDEGIVESFSIIFCNEDGLDCIPCSPNGGMIGIDDLRGCQGSDSLNQDLGLTFNPEPADSMDFDYRYIITQGGIIIDVLDSSDLRDYPAGAFTLHGISISMLDSNGLDTFLNRPFNDLFNELRDGDNICAELTSNNIPIQIFETPNPTFDTLQICIGDTLFFADSMYTQSGDYFHSLLTINGCDSVVNLHLDVLDPIAIVADPDTLTCTLDTIILSGDGSSIGPEFGYQWIEITGELIEPLDQMTARTNQSGEYALVVLQDLCADTSRFVRAEIDTLGPEINVTFDSITCMNPVIELFAEAIDPGVDFTWILADSSILFGDSIETSVPGGTEIIATGRNGCITREVFNVPADTALPVVIWQVDSLDCTGDTIRITSNPASEDYIYNWSGPDGFVNDEAEPEIWAAGAFEVTVTNTEGCETIFSISVFNRMDTPVVELFVEALSCRSDSAELRATDIPGYSYTWSGPQGTLSEEAMAYTPTPGQHQLEVLNDITGCSSHFVANVEDIRTVPSGSITLDTITCDRPTAELSVMTDADSVRWTGPGGIDTDLFTVNVSLPGLHNVQLVNTSNGCDTTLTAPVEIDTIVPAIQIVQPDSIGCNQQILLIDASASATGPSINYEWTTRNGEIESGRTSSVLTVNRVGTYILEVRDMANGCRASDSVTVHGISDLPQGIGFRLTSPNCPPETTGMLEVLFIQGGQGPYEYSVDASAFQPDPMMDNILPGDHTIRGIDMRGCIVDSVFTILDPRNPMVQLPADTLVFAGSSIDIRYGSNLNPDEIQSVLWLDGADTLCIGCNPITAAPDVTTTYNLILVDTAGCLATDEVTISIQTYSRLYIPTAFSPNDDGVNDSYVVFAGGNVISLPLIEIYDRWGERVFQRTNIPPGDIRFAWDGTFNGAQAPPALYVVKVIAQLSDGQEITRFGQLHLIR